MTEGTVPLGPGTGTAPVDEPTPRAAADPTHLRAHLGQCAAARGGLHHLRGALAAMDALLQPRFLSTLAALALALAAWALLWAGPAA